ncbi:hypothetical protein AVEN_60534-2-1, partial [Araneus ventricosus]
YKRTTAYTSLPLLRPHYAQCFNYHECVSTEKISQALGGRSPQQKTASGTLCIDIRAECNLPSPTLDVGYKQDISSPSAELGVQILFIRTTKRSCVLEYSKVPFLRPSRVNFSEKSAETKSNLTD